MAAPALFLDPLKKKRSGQFVPSGRDPKNKTIGDYQITIYYPVYYSNEENFDTSKDKPASVTVSYKGGNSICGKRLSVFTD